MYSNDEKTDMTPIYGECKKNRDNKHFPKNSWFFTILFNQANDVYVKIYATAQLCVLCILNLKNISFAKELWVAFSIQSGSLSLVKYPVY
jgi:hypothetical protein